MSSLTLDAEGLYRELLKAMQLLMAGYSEPPQLVGIASGGVWLAERLQADLKLAGKIGILSSAMHRDDFAKRGLATSSQTQLPFDVNGAHLMLVDDVLYTGRTLRAVSMPLTSSRTSVSAKPCATAARSASENDVPWSCMVRSTKAMVPLTQPLTAYTVSPVSKMSRSVVSTGRADPTALSYSQLALLARCASCTRRKRAIGPALIFRLGEMTFTPALSQRS